MRMDLPSTWDASVKSQAEEIAYSILKTWSSEVREKDKIFAILYIPRGGEFLSPESQERDTWKKWLDQSCKTLKIPLLDPSKALFEKQEAGIQVYDDHFTKSGHGVVGQFIDDWLVENFEDIKDSSIN